MNLKQVKRQYVGDVLILTLILAAFCVTSGVGVAAVFAADGQETAARPTVGGDAQAAPRWDLSIAIAASVGLSCLAAGYAVGRVGAAALGAASEKPELLTRSLPFVALGEGIAIFGFVVALLLSFKL